MRQIKFRGHEFFSKKFVYGQTITQTFDGWDFWDNERADWIHCTDCNQLIGVDANGLEVYENDKVIRVAGDDFNPEKTFPMQATFEDFAAIRDEEIILVEESQ